MKLRCFLSLCIAFAGCAPAAPAHLAARPAATAAPAATGTTGNFPAPIARRAAACHADRPAPRGFSLGDVLFAAPTTAAPVSQVEVRGSELLVPDSIMNQLASKKGSPPDPAAIRADMERLWKLGLFEDVRAETRSSVNGLVLTYMLVDKPRLGEAYLEGADHVSAEELRDVASDSGLVALFGRAELDQTARLLRERLEDNGYRFAEVEARARRFDGSTVDVCLHVKEGPRVIIDRWTFVGNQNVRTEELLASMRTEDGNFNAPGGVYRKDLAEYNLLVINELYHNRGMIEVRVSDPVLTVGSGRTSLSVDVTINEGLVYRIGRMEVVRDAKRAHAYERVVRQKKGQIFSRKAAQEDIERIRAEIQKKERRDVDVVPEMELDKARATVDVRLKIEAR